MNLQQSGEMYLETILLLSQSGEPVHSVAVAKHMGFSKPSVSRAVSILRDGGYITADAEGHLGLTASGRAIAEKIYERHQLLTELLVQLGVDRKTAGEDACRMEHDISDASLQAIKDFTMKNRKP